MIDINLTGQLWGMPVSLIGQAAQACNISTLPANLTIVNQMAATNTWIIAAIGALGAIFGALAGGLATYIIENLKIKNMDAQRRQQAYSQLYGRKGAYLQCYVSYFVNFIALEKSIAMRDFGLRIPEMITLGSIAYSTKSIIDPQIPDVLFAKSDEFALRLSQSRQDVWEVIGLIKLLFTNTDDKLRAIEDFDRKFDPFEDEIRKDQENGLIEFQYEVLPHSRLDITTRWYKTKETKLREEYIKEFDKIFDHLLDYLKMEIQREQEETKKKGWWQFWK